MYNRALRLSEPGPSGPGFPGCQLSLSIMATTFKTTRDVYDIPTPDGTKHLLRYMCASSHAGNKMLTGMQPTGSQPYRCRCCMVCGCQTLDCYGA